MSSCLLLLDILPALVVPLRFGRRPQTDVLRAATGAGLRHERHIQVQELVKELQRLLHRRRAGDESDLVGSINRGVHSCCGNDSSSRSGLSGGGQELYGGGAAGLM